MGSKKKKTKKVLALLLSLCLFAEQGQFVLAEDVQTSGAAQIMAGEDSLFTVTDGVLTGYGGEEEHVVIPDNLGITEIGGDAFRNDAATSSNLKSIVIPEGVTTIQNGAFMHCQALESVEFPSTLKTIGDSAFYSCKSLGSLSFPDSLEKIGVNAFYQCEKLAEVQFGTGLENIGAHAFSYCYALTGIVLPDSVTELGEGAFHGCSGLVDAQISSALTVIAKDAFRICTALESVEIPDNVREIKETAFYGCSSLDVVNFGDNSNLSMIAKDAFSGTKWYTDQKDDYLVLNGVLFQYKGTDSYSTYYIPESVEVIGPGVFENYKNARAFILSDGVIRIEERAFAGCTNMTGITIPESVREIAADAFADRRADLVITGEEGSYAQQYAEEHGITFETFPEEFIVENGVLTGYNGTDTEIVVPDNMGITAIGDYVFRNSGIEKIVIPDGVTEIGDSAFDGCSALSDITLPANLIEIGSYAFEECESLADVKLPQGLKEIGYRAFYRSGLTEVTLPGGLETLGNEIFSYCDSLTKVTLEEGVPYISNYMFNYCKKLQEVTIPSSVSRIGDWAFSNCYALAEVTLPSSVESVGQYAFQNCSSLAKIELNEGLKSLGSYAFQNCTALTEVKLPDSLSSIGSSVFSGCDILTSISLPTGMTELGGIFTGLEGITRVEIPQGVRKIGNSAFSGCVNLEEIVIPDSVTEIGTYAFENCKKLKTVELPEGIGKISDYAFRDSGIEKIVIPDSVTEIGDSAFDGCSALSEITLPANLIEIGSYAFEECESLTDVKLPQGLKEIGYRAFYRSGLTEVTLPGDLETLGNEIFSYCDSLTKVTLEEGVPYISNYMFSYCNKLQEVTIPSSVSRIGDWAFSNCYALAEVSLPSSVESVGQYAFYNCSSLAKVELNEGLKSIGSYAFQNCTALTEVKLPDSLSSIGSSVFSGCDILTSISLPTGMTELGGIFTGLEGITRVEIPQGVKKIGNSAFSGCVNLEEIVIPDSVTEIGTYAFENCKKLKTVELPEGIGKISDYAFRDSGIEKIVIPDSVTEIGYEAFEDCTALKSITVSENLTKIEQYAFRNCQNLKEVTLPRGLTEIGYNAFYNSGLTEVTLPGSLETLGSESFSQCDSLTKVVLEEGVPYISSYMFSYCDQLKEMTIPSSVSRIETSAFQGSKVLTEVSLPSSVESVGRYAFEGCSSLAKVELNEGLKSLGDCAFQNCTALTEVKLPDSLSSIGSSVFNGCTNLITILLPKGLKNLGGIFTGLKGITYVALPDGLETIGDSAFSGCTNLQEIIIPESVETIGNYAFQNCKKLSSIRLPEKLIEIPISAFYGSGLTKIDIPKGVVRIENNAFAECADLSSVTLPASLTTLEYRAFYNSGLAQATLPGSLRTIGTDVFYNCRQLTDVVLEDGVTAIADSMFYNCTKLENITIPESVASIGYRAFYGCTGLQETLISEGTESIGDDAFRDCTSLERVVLPKSLTSFGSNVFYNSPKVVIEGFRGSKAEDYAAANGIAFTPIDGTAPETPQNFAVKKVSGSAVTLSWEASYDSFGEASYLIYRDGEEIARTKEHSYKDTEVEAGKVYEYEIAAYNIYNIVSDRASITASPVMPKITKVGLQSGEDETGGEEPVILEACVTDQKNLEGVKANFYYAKEGENWILLGEGGAIQREEEKLYQISWPLKELETGNYQIRFEVADEDGNVSAKEANIRVDRTAPSTIFGLTAFGDASKIALSWGIAAEMKTESYRIYRRTDGEPTAVLLKEVQGRETLSYNDFTAQRGVGYWYSISGVDKYGQEGERTKEVYGALTEDNLAPEVTRISPENGSYLKENVTFQVWVSDNEKLKSVKMEISQNEGDTYEVVGEKTCTGITEDQVAFDVDTSKFADGKTLIRLTVTDEAGNKSIPLERTYYIDNIAPAKITGVTAEATATTILVKWTIPKDDVSYFEVEEKTGKDEDFVLTEKVTGTNGVNLLKRKPNTTYWYRVRGVDRSGNQGEYSDVLEVRTNADSTDPVITQMSPQEGYVSNGLTMTVHAWDDDQIEWVGVQTSYDGQDWTLLTGQTLAESKQNVEVSVNLDFRALREGLIFARAIARDRAGNLSDISVKAPFVQYVIDRTAPKKPAFINVIPQSGYVDIEWEIQEQTDIDHYELYRSTDPQEGFTKISSFIKDANYRDVNAKADTTYYYKVRAIDWAQNASEFSDVSKGVMRLEDTIKPIVEKIDPVSGTALGKEYRNVSVYATDDIGIASVQLEYKDEGDADFTVLEKKTLSKIYNKTWVNFELPSVLFGEEGTLTIRAIAEDVGGNRSKILEASYQKDATAPSVSHILATQMKEEVILSWDGGQEKDLAGYVIYRKLEGESEFSRIGSVNGESKEAFYEWKDFDLPDEDTTAIYRVEAVDVVGNTSYADSTILTLKAEKEKDEQAPTARFDLTGNMEVGVEYAFDASDSSDNVGIVSYLWDFGDGQTASSQMAVHKYESTGDYTVRLTVVDAAGNETYLEKEVRVLDRSIMGTLQVTVRDDAGNPVANAPVYFDLGETHQTIRYTGTDGKTSLLMPVGNHKVGVYQDGYLPAVKQAYVQSNTTTLTSLIAVKEDLVEAEFDIRNMTLEEIVAAGIDVADPASQHIMKLNVNVTIGYRTLAIPCYINDTGSYVKTGAVIYTSDSGQQRVIMASPFIPGYETEGSLVGDHEVESKPIVGLVDIPIEATFLKEFFEVRMYIINNATTEFSLLDNEVTLNVPQGLTIVDTKDSIQGATATVDEIKGSSQQEFKWILRGDDPGTYDISVSFQGTLDQFQIPVKAEFECQDPVKVYGTEGLRILLDIKEDIVDGAMYYNVGFQNLSREEIYLPNLRIIDDNDVLQAVLLGKCKVNEYGYMETLSNTERLKTLYKGETLYHKYVKYNVADPEAENAYVVDAIEKSTEGLDIELVINIVKDFEVQDPFEKLGDLSVGEKSSYEYLMTHENYYYWHAAYQNEPDAAEHFGVNLFDYKDPAFRLGNGDQVFAWSKSQIKMAIVTLFETAFENNKVQLGRQAGEEIAEMYREGLLQTLAKANLSTDNLAGIQKAQLGQMLINSGFYAMNELFISVMTEEQKEVLDVFANTWIREQKAGLLVAGTISDKEFAEIYHVLLKKQAQAQYLEELFDAAREGYSPQNVQSACEELKAAALQHYTATLEEAGRGAAISQEESLGQWVNLSSQEMEQLIGRAVNAKTALELVQLVSYLSFSMANGIDSHYDAYTKHQDEKEAVLTTTLLEQLADLRYAGETMFRNYVSFLDESDVLNRSNTENGTNFESFDQWYENAIQILNDRRQQILQSGSGLASLPDTPVVTVDYGNACTVESFDDTYEYSINNGPWTTCDGGKIAITPSSFTQTLRVRKRASESGFAGNIGRTIIGAKERIYRNLEIRWTEQGYEVKNMLPGKTYQYLEMDSAQVKDPDWSKAKTVVAESGTNLLQSDQFHPYLWMRIVPEQGAEGFASDVESYLVLGLRKIEVKVEGEGQVSGQGSYEYGEKVTLTATPAAGYRFVGWFNQNQLLSSSETYTLEATENLNLTARFEELKEVNVELSLSHESAGVLSGGGIYKEGETVTIMAAEIYGNGYRFVGWQDESGNWFARTPSVIFKVGKDVKLTAVYEEILYTVTINIEGQGTVTGAENKIRYGTEAVLQAAPEEGYFFDGWEMNKKIISRESTYRFVVTGDTTIKARFFEEQTAAYKVVFQDINGDVIKTEFVEEGGIATAPEGTLYKPGRIFKGWGEQVKEPIYQDTVFVAQYDWEEVHYSVQVVNGTFQDGETSKECTFDEKIQVTAEEEKDGMVFGYWLVNGSIASYDRESSFYVSGEMVLEAVYTEQKEEEKPVIWMDQETVVNAGDKSATFLCKMSVPSKMKLVETGIIYTAKLDIANGNDFILGTSGTAKVKALSQTKGGEFSITLKGIPVGKTAYAKAYLIYQDEEGSIHTIYTEEYAAATIK